MINFLIYFDIKRLIMFKNVKDTLSNSQYNVSSKDYLSLYGKILLYIHIFWSGQQFLMLAQDYPQLPSKFKNFNH